MSMQDEIESFCRELDQMKAEKEAERWRKRWEKKKKKNKEMPIDIRHEK